MDITLAGSKVKGDELPREELHDLCVIIFFANRVQVLMAQVNGNRCPSSSDIMSLCITTARRSYNEPLVLRLIPCRRFALLCTLTAGKLRSCSVVTFLRYCAWSRLSAARQVPGSNPRCRQFCAFHENHSNTELDVC